MTSRRRRPAECDPGPAGRDATAAQAAAGRRSNVLTLGMLALLIYFLLPLFWLVVASTKTTGDLFSSFGLWFADDVGAAVANIRDTFTYDGGVYGRWMLNTLFYSVVSAGGGRAASARSAATASPSTAFRGNGIALRPGARLDHGADHRAGHPHLPAVQPGRPGQHAVGDHPAVAGQPVRALPDADLRAGRHPGQPDRGRAASTAPASSRSSSGSPCAPSRRASSPSCCSPWWPPGTTTSCR